MAENRTSIYTRYNPHEGFMPNVASRSAVTSGKMPNTVIVIAARNEATTIASIVREAKKYGDVIVVDDASTDDTFVLAYNAGASVAFNSIRMNIRASFMSGFKSAIEQGYDYIVQMDAGGSHNPYDIQGLKHKLLATNADMVVGSRFINGGFYIGGKAWRKAMSRAASWAVTRKVDMPHFTDVTSGFRIYRAHTLRPILKHFNPEVLARAHAFQFQILYLVWFLGFSIAESPITYRATNSSVNAASIIEALGALLSLQKL